MQTTRRGFLTGFLKGMGVAAIAGPFCSLEMAPRIFSKRGLFLPWKPGEDGLYTIEGDPTSYRRWYRTDGTPIWYEMKPRELWPSYLTADPPTEAEVQEVLAEAIQSIKWRRGVFD